MPSLCDVSTSTAQAAGWLHCVQPAGLIRYKHAAFVTMVVLLAAAAQDLDQHYSVVLQP